MHGTHRLDFAPHSTMDAQKPDHSRYDVKKCRLRNAKSIPTSDITCIITLQSLSSLSHYALSHNSLSNYPPISGRLLPSINCLRALNICTCVTNTACTWPRHLQLLETPLTVPRDIPVQPGTNSSPKWWLEGLLCTQRMHSWNRSYPDPSTYQSATPKLQKCLRSQHKHHPCIRARGLCWCCDADLRPSRPANDDLQKAQNEATCDTVRLWSSCTD